MDPAFASSQKSAVYQDGLGERRRISDVSGADTIEQLCLRGELTAVPSFEFALRERASRLVSFRHVYYGRVRSIDRLSDPSSTLAIVSDSIKGIRLANLLVANERRPLTLDINASLHLLRQLVSAVAMLHETARDVAHGAIGPERIIVTPNARLVIVEYVLGAALEQLRFSRERYWKEMRVALPPSPARAHFDHRADVTQVGVVALSLVLGRMLHDDEYPDGAADVLELADAISSTGVRKPLPQSLRTWIGRALQLDPRHSFANALEARDELDRVLSGEQDEDVASIVGTASSPPPEPIVSAFMPAATPAPATNREAGTPRTNTRTKSQMTPAAAEALSAFAAEAPTPAAQAPAPVSPITPASPLSPTSPIGNPARSEWVRVDPPRAEPARAESARVEPVRTEPARVELPRPEPPHVEPMRFEAPHPADDEESDDEEAAPSLLSRLPVNRAAAIAAAVVILSTAGVFGVRKLLNGGAEVSQTGTLNISSNPAGAQVIVDGQSSGVTPLVLALKPGTHNVELRGGVEPRTFPVTITAGTQVTQYIELPKAPTAFGQLQVRTEPAGAQVTVDGIPRGKSPVLVESLAAGDHTVVLDNNGANVKHSVSVEAGMTASLVVPLPVPAEAAPLSGWLTVSAPVEVQLLENKKLIGTSQSDRIMVGAGRHEIEIVNEALGYRAVRSIQVAAGKTTPLRLEWPKGSIAINALPWAEVWIDGERVGETPIGNLALPIGPHELIFRHPDLGEQRYATTVSLREPARVSVDLRKK